MYRAIEGLANFVPCHGISNALVSNILSIAILYICVIDAKHFLNDPNSDKNAIMSSVLIPQGKAIYRLYTV